MKKNPEISERFANYIIRVNYPDFLSKKVTINYLDKKKGHHMKSNAVYKKCRDFFSFDPKT